MFSRGKIVGPILIVLGAGICLLVSAFMGVGIANQQLSPGGAALGIVLFGALPLFFFAGVGTYLLISGRKEEAEREIIRKKERILGLVQAQGQVSLSTIMMEMKMSREEVTNAIYELVAMGLFTGYADWDALTFYSREASQVGSNQCPNCGGIREFVGQGVIKCPYCGVSLFIPPGVENRRAEPRPPEAQAVSTQTD